MKRIVYILIIIVILLPITWLVYVLLPFEITRKSDITFGNTLVNKIKDYKEEHTSLPPANDWQLLESIGFKLSELGTEPVYNRINNNEYELIYPDGFDGPYLLYNSKENKWKIDFPTFSSESIH